MQLMKQDFKLECWLVVTHEIQIEFNQTEYELVRFNKILLRYLRAYLKGTDSAPSLI